MQDAKQQLKEFFRGAIVFVMEGKGIPQEEIMKVPVVLETPPKPELGDVGFPCFTYAKPLRMAPPAIALAVKALLDGNSEAAAAAEWVCEGPYVNAKIRRTTMIVSTLNAVAAAGDSWGNSKALDGRRIMVEFSCPNTNKPLHLGHLRNDALGESVSRILKRAGADVMKVNLINDRGVHICKSMLAYMKRGEGRTPSSEGLKGDHFVGSYYVMFKDLAESGEVKEDEAQAMLVKWEDGDKATIDLWKTMNSWTIEGMNETYRRTGISFDKVYLESETYKKGKDEVLRGLDEGVFFKADDGSIRIGLEDIGLDTKVLLRGDGTSIYMTQDIGTAIDRHKDWPFTNLVYVVASEQQYHFRVLFHVLEKLGFDWAKNLFHLSYGMVNLPEGRMKTREGTVVDADSLIDELTGLALEEIGAKGREDSVGDLKATAEKIALGALHYYLLQTTPTKDMIFNPKESLSFTGNTGPYIQYMGARLASMLRKWALESRGMVKPELLANEAEWMLVKLCDEFPEKIAEAGREMNPQIVIAHLYALAGVFSSYYHDNPMANNSDPDLAATRMALAKAVWQVLKNGMDLVLIPYLAIM